MSEPVYIKRVDSVAHLVIDRPDARNAMNMEVNEKLRKYLADIKHDETIKAVLLYGEGQKAFCSGADLKELSDAGSEENRRKFFQSVADVIIDIQKLSKPVVAKVHGYALAGGCGLAAACDIVLASDEASFGLPEINIGLLPLIVMAPIQRTIGTRALMDLVLTGERIDSAEAHRIGLATRVFKKKALDEEANNFTSALAEKSPLALKLGKEAVYQVGELEYQKAFSMLVDKVTDFSAMDDFNEGVSAFFEKRSPIWSGK